MGKRKVSLRNLISKNYYDWCSKLSYHGSKREIHPKWKSWNSGFFQHQRIRKKIISWKWIEWNRKITSTWAMESWKRIRARKSKNLIWIKKTWNWKRNGDSKNWKRKKTSWRETWVRKNWAWKIKRDWNFKIWKRKRTLKIKNWRRGS